MTAAGCLALASEDLCSPSRTWPRTAKTPESWCERGHEQEACPKRAGYKLKGAARWARPCRWHSGGADSSSSPARLSPAGAVPAGTCSGARCPPQHLPTAPGEPRGLLRPCLFPNGSPVLRGHRLQPACPARAGSSHTSAHGNVPCSLLTPAPPRAAAQSSFHLSPLQKRGKGSEPGPP